MDLLEKMASLPAQDLCQLNIPLSLQLQALEILSKRYWPFHQGNNIQHILSPHHFGQQEELIIFGGSFSPWHEGHAQALRTIKTIRPKGVVVVCPDWNPQKASRSDLGMGIDRWVTVSKAVSQEFPDVYVYPGLLLWQRPTPTSQWLPDVKYPIKSILIGADSFYGILQWIMPEKLLPTLKSIYVLPRGDSNEEFEDMKNKILQLSFLYQKLEITRLPHHPYEKVSSTLYRKGP